MYTHYGKQDQAEWKGTEVQWEGGYTDYEDASPGNEDREQSWEERRSGMTQGTEITYYEQERQDWGRSTKREGEMGSQEGAVPNRQGGRYEDQISQDHTEHVIQGRVIGYTTQTAIRQEEESRKEHQEAEQQRIWEN